MLLALELEVIQLVLLEPLELVNVLRWSLRTRSKSRPARRSPRISDMRYAPATGGEPLA
jgi:hypothetical protein